MPPPIVLASGSHIRLQLLLAAGIDAMAVPARIDEEAVMTALVAEKATPRDIADTLAEMKAARVAPRFPGQIVLGCDQVLDHGGDLLSKPETVADARRQLQRLRGQKHHLLSALVLYENQRPVWRFVGEAFLAMNNFSDAYLEGYLARNWPGLASSVGAYKLEEEGVRLFSEILGDHFTILGLPLLPLIAYLGQRGFIPA